MLAVCEPVIYGPPEGAAFAPGRALGRGRAAPPTTPSARRCADAQRGTRRTAIATAPVNKLAFAHAGLPWKGHTDLLGHLTGSRRVAMMFWSEPLKVVLATVHVPLAEVPARAHPRGARRDHRPDRRASCRASASPRHALALAGLNPHAGEDGLLGDEEQRVLRPAVEAARAPRHRASTARSPATRSSSAPSRGEFDVVIACYHDQGLIPVKLLAFGRAVNVTLGLPIVRTSVDHGTAFDIAGRGMADPSSMIEAVLLAARLAGRREPA